VSPFTARLNFHGDLSFFLKSKTAQLVERRLARKSSVKDIIESCAVPHSEVDLILVEGQPVDFAFVLDSDRAVDVYPPQFEPSTFFPENRLQTQHSEKFVADGHLGKLVRDLRLLGLDVVYDAAAEDRQLVSVSSDENRALLTRDRRLLMYAVVEHGYYLRSQDPLEQTIEVVRRFHLISALAPFTRCVRCNGMLRAVQKTEIIEKLEPLTKAYYEEFRRCTACAQIYWRGSHFAKLEARIANLKQQL
jgi:uncharacterized protein with PIN domain